MSLNELITFYILLNGWQRRIFLNQTNDNPQDTRFTAFLVNFGIGLLHHFQENKIGEFVQIFVIGYAVIS
ncbi:protein of unknown function [Shewanella benthica]|uniref:Uncharacterized protein n=1 Tax=Shewanella benthica TaxID=43661 RepID=A0A330M1C9_9GAMM|nr:protein of unknown function [Shewanella benthica]